MPSFDPEDFFNQFENVGFTPENVDKAFKKLAALPKDEYKANIDAIEDYIVNKILQEELPDLQDLGVREYKKELLNDSKDEPLIFLQSMAQIVLNIRNAKDKEASPLVKAFAEAAAKLTDKEYNSAQVLVKPMVAAVKKAANPGKSNPFRQ